MVLSGGLSLVIGQHKREHPNLRYLPASVALSYVSFLFSFASIVFLAYAFAVDDFSLSYVSQNSNSLLDVPYKIAATWGGHEGSMLFWVVTLALWGAVIARKSFQSIALKHDTLWIMHLLVAIFSWFTFLASNPFEFNQILPLEGRDLNPMLQDIGLIIHPPMLYLGYVGFASVLALAVGCLLSNTLTDEWIKAARVYCLVAWGFLTVGIAIGSWWAYYELGWGGWWFWDPVENASLLPWLTSTALLHVLVVGSNQNQMRYWCYSLAFITYCLSILGTFIVRSGVLTSVHAFAIDPGKGFSLLGILTVIFVSAFTLLIARAESVSSTNVKGMLSKNFLVVVCANLFVLAMVVVLFGTFYPMVYEMIGLGNISVGAPYFNLLFAPLAVLALFMSGFAPLLQWESTTQLKPTNLKRALLLLLSCSLILAGIVIFVYSKFEDVAGAELKLWPLITTFVAIFVLLSHFYGLVTARFNLRKLWVSIAHVGVAVAAFGISMNSYYSYELTRKLGPNSSMEFGRYQVSYLKTELLIANNYTSEQAHILIGAGENGVTSRLALPEKRHYQVRVMNMTEPSMSAFWNGDVYITLGEKVDATHYAVRIQFKAFVRWIWAGAALVVLAVLGLLWQALQRHRIIEIRNKAKRRTLDSHVVSSKKVANHD
jgi:cytochrome c-type biogenesis protein CcmF